MCIVNIQLDNGDISLKINKQTANSDKISSKI